MDPVSEPDQLPTEPRTLRLAIGPADIALFASVLYVVGFLISNAHFARYEALRADILRSRYIAAALLFVFITGFPAALGLVSFAMTQSLSPLSPLRWIRRFGVPLLLVVALLSVWLAALNWMSAASFSHIWSGYVGYVLTSVLAGLAIGMGLARPSRRYDRIMELGDRLLNVTWGSFILFAFSVMFSGLIYPHIYPAYGGGAAWRGRIILSTAADSSLASHAELGPVMHPVLIVDRTSDVLAVMACAKSPPAGQPHVITIEIPVRAVGGVILEDLVSVPVESLAMWRTCSRTSRKAASSAAQRPSMLARVQKLPTGAEAGT